MDCRTCEPTLIDLVHSELATDAAREAHAHLATCASCRTSFETLMAATRLASQLQMVEPPQHVAPRVMELAQAHAREALARQRVVAPRPTPWQAFLDFVGRLATLPQVAMATVMVLIVSVGLWSLPRLRQESAPASTVVVNPEPPEGEVAAATGVEPAQPLDLKVDMRAGRIRSKDGLPLQQPAAAASAEPVVEPEALAKNERNSDDPFAALDDVDLGEAERRGGGARDKEGAAAPGAAKAKGDLSERVLAAKPAATRSVASERNEGLSSGARRTRSAEPPLPLGVSASRASAPARPDPQAFGAEADEPREEKKSAPKAAASETSAGPSPSDMAASSLVARLEAARSLARENGCGSALPSYQRIVSAAPTSFEAGHALLEMARCRHAAGDIAAARKLLERATAIPAVASSARALLETLQVPSTPAAASEKAAP